MTTETPASFSNFKDESPKIDINVEDLLLNLRRKQGNWVEWGQACQQLQKAGYNPQAIFEATGFEPIHQNQLIVGAQVYTTMVAAGVSETVRSHFLLKGSDTLYELRILTQPQRAAAAEYIVSRNIDSEGSKEVAKAVKEFSYRSTLPEGFSNHPGDAVAYQYWRLAKQHSELPEKSRCIARGLMFAHTQTARKQIEMLLTDMGNSQRPAPILPFYRLEAEEELPRIIPVVGKLPLTITDLQTKIMFTEIGGAFQVIKSPGNQDWIALPGWQVVLNADDPVVILGNTNQLPAKQNNLTEDVIILVDRAQTQWDINSYFVFEESGKVELRWFPEKTELPLLGKVVLVLRPKRMLDESSNKDIWQIED